MPCTRWMLACSIGLQAQCMTWSANLRLITELSLSWWPLNLSRYRAAPYRVQLTFAVRAARWWTFGRTDGQPAERAVSGVSACNGVVNQPTVACVWHHPLHWKVTLYTATPLNRCPRLESLNRLLYDSQYQSAPRTNCSRTLLCGDRDRQAYINALRAAIGIDAKATFIRGFRANFIHSIHTRCCDTSLCWRPLPYTIDTCPTWVAPYICLPDVVHHNCLTSSDNCAYLHRI